MKKLSLAVLLLLPAAARSQETLPEFEPLVISAPRLRVPKDMPIDPQINMYLLRLLQQRADARPDSQAALDASIGNLAKLTTATGYKLKTRYTELGFLLTEGLAGVKDFQLAGELERVARQGKNVQTRAAAMVALAYTKDLQYMSLFQGALLDPNITVRFGALESLLILDNPAAQFLIANAAANDASPTLRVYAAAGMWSRGDINGRELLLRMYLDQDSFIRALSTRYLGEMGGADEYRKLLQQLSNEQDSMVRVELASALLRLQNYNR